MSAHALQALGIIAGVGGGTALAIKNGYATAQGATTVFRLFIPAIVTNLGESVWKNSNKAAEALQSGNFIDFTEATGDAIMEALFILDLSKFLTSGLAGAGRGLLPDPTTPESSGLPERPPCDLPIEGAGGSSCPVPPGEIGSPTATEGKLLAVAEPTTLKVGEPPQCTKPSPENSFAPNTRQPKVTAEGTVQGKTFTDTNQTARVGGDPNKPTLIESRVKAKQAKAKHGKTLPNANMADAHAEIGVIQQAFDAGLTKGADMVMTVTGQRVCGYCLGDIAAAAQEAGLKSLTVNEVATGKTLYWKPGWSKLRENP